MSYTGLCSLWRCHGHYNISYTNYSLYCKIRLRCWENPSSAMEDYIRARRGQTSLCRITTRKWIIDVHRYLLTGRRWGVGGLPTAIVGVVGEWANLVSPENLGVSTRLFEYNLYANDAQGEQQIRSYGHQHRLLFLIGTYSNYYNRHTWLRAVLLLLLLYYRYYDLRVIWYATLLYIGNVVWCNIY